MGSIAYVGLGSNLGNPEEHLANALKGIEKLGGVELLGVSPLYTTEPQGYADQPWFLNQVAQLDVSGTITPGGLLDMLLNLELSLGRRRPYMDRGRPERASRAERFGPRVIDLDLLTFDNQVIRTERMVLPHPRMHKRAFVLVPLRDIAPDFMFPDGTTIDEALSKITYEVHGNAIHQ